MNMPPPHTLLALVGTDAKNIVRDPIMLLGVMLSFLPALLLFAFGATAEAAAREAFSFVGMAQVLGAMACLMPGAMLGWVAGFLLIEERDETVLTAIGVTPMGTTGFVTYRLGLAGLVIFLLSLGAALLVLEIGLVGAFAIALLSVAHGLVSTLILVAFAGNKVEGLAITKIINLSLLAPSLALLPQPLRYLGFMLPGLWIGEIALPIDGLHGVLALGIGLLASIAIALALLRRTAHRIG